MVVGWPLFDLLTGRLLLDWVGHGLGENWITVVTEDLVGLWCVYSVVACEFVWNCVVNVWRQHK